MVVWIEDGYKPLHFAFNWRRGRNWTSQQIRRNTHTWKETSWFRKSAVACGKLLFTRGNYCTYLAKENTLLIMPILLFNVFCSRAYIWFLLERSFRFVKWRIMTKNVTVKINKSDCQLSCHTRSQFCSSQVSNEINRDVNATLLIRPKLFITIKTLRKLYKKH